jgi:hypothetical protein
VTRWRPGEADVELRLAAGEFQIVTESAADGEPGLARARQTLASAEVLFARDPTNAFVLAYDAVRQACTALLAHQGLRPTATGGHIAVERAVRAPFAPYSGLRRRRNDVEYPAHAGVMLDAAAKLLPRLGPFST